MEDINDLTSFSARKASILSQKESQQKNEKENKIHDNAPPDVWNLCYVIFFLYGLFSFLAIPFLTNAQDYWLYKFRNTSIDHVDNNNRTALQANFLSSLSLAAIPSTLASILTARYGHKLHMRTRLIGSVFLCALVFILMMVFIYQDTDTWQFGFFIMTLAFAGAAMLLSQVFTVSQMGLISRFPKKYLKAQMYGQSLGGILSSSLQIFALAVGKDSLSKAMIYFACGTVVILITLVLTFLSRFSSCYVYYEGDSTADTERPTATLKDYKNVLRKIWTVVVIQINMTIGMTMSFPSIANLVISEYYGQGSEYLDVYFPIVITYLMPEVLSISAKYLASPLMTPKNAFWWVIAQTILTYATSPLFLFCNAQPRSHLPVLLEHDWEYIILMFGSAVVKTYFLCVGIMSMGNLAQEDVEIAFVVSTSLSQVVFTAIAPLNSVFVNIL